MQVEPGRLKFFRERRGWNQSDLATHAGLSRPYISQIEAGIREPSPPAVNVIIKALGITLDDLVPHLVTCPHCGTSFIA